MRLASGACQSRFYHAPFVARLNVDVAQLGKGNLGEEGMRRAKGEEPAKLMHAYLLCVFVTASIWREGV